jgi:hypothetical protein
MSSNPRKMAQAFIKGKIQANKARDAAALAAAQPPPPSPPRRRRRK